jgi:ribosomal protein L11 methyltransferase
VLLDEIAVYATLLVDQGYLFLSGFYETDLPQILEMTTKHNLKEVKHTTRKNWVGLILQKV